MSENSNPNIMECPPSPARATGDDELLAALVSTKPHEEIMEIVAKGLEQLKDWKDSLAYATEIASRRRLITKNLQAEVKLARKKMDAVENKWNRDEQKLQQIDAKETAIGREMKALQREAEGLSSERRALQDVHYSSTTSETRRAVAEYYTTTLEELEKATEELKKAENSRNVWRVKVHNASTRWAKETKESVRAKLNIPNDYEWGLKNMTRNYTMDLTHALKDFGFRGANNLKKAPSKVEVMWKRICKVLGIEIPSSTLRDDAILAALDIYSSSKMAASPERGSNPNIGGDGDDTPDPL